MSTSWFRNARTWRRS